MEVSFRSVTMELLGEKAQKDWEFLRLTLEQGPDAIFCVDASGRCHRVNERACKWLGYSREELQAMTVYQFCPDYRANEWLELWGKIRKGKQRTLETNFRTKGGRLIPVEVSCNLVEFDGKEYGFAFARDITERKQAKVLLGELRRHNELILNSAGEGIFGLDLQGRHTFVNPAAANLLGYKVEELLGKPSHQTWHHTKPNGSPYPPQECPIYKVYKDGMVHQGDDELFWRKGGSGFPVQYTSTPIRDEKGNLVGAVVTFQDLTEKKTDGCPITSEALSQTDEQLIDNRT